MNLNENEKRVLAFLEEKGDEYCYPFYPIQEATELDRRHVRLACRSLARKGLAVYIKGLASEHNDSGLGGAGYSVTLEGINLIQSQQKPIPQL